MLTPSSILTTTDIEDGNQSIPNWFKKEYAHWKKVVSDKGFPCPYGTVAERMGHLRYFYIENDDFHSLPHVLREFLKLSRGSKNRHAFVIFIKPEILEKPFAYYETYFWDILNYLHEHDEVEWCKDISIHPDDANWEFCYDGEPIFVSANMPGYKRRITRNIGNSLILIFQPRRIFSGISYKTNRGEKAIKLIRSRVESIEKLPFHPDLGGYGDEGYREWKQYIITDDTEPRSGQCPFRITNQESKK
ncbi:YqcI/YcgG family protein [Oceanobacillus zhaokaii]|uniref:YqcI/YcgG family protein n=1 Tax=Oceanobacillus zhaokaii TaxID=2052660 RepID=A0A345PK35_9BACI|nr:YqcI/YcgG family protein [Oceanobacillus zhaokaii]AXI10365.1 YqcI/YcgG family protein [Oceanobacillus zhaokaii]